MIHWTSRKSQTYPTRNSKIEQEGNSSQLYWLENTSSWILTKMPAQWYLTRKKKNKQVLGYYYSRCTMMMLSTVTLTHCLFGDQRLFYFTSQPRLVLILLISLKSTTLMKELQEAGPWWFFILFQTLPRWIVSLYQRKCLWSKYEEKTFLQTLVRNLCREQMMSILIV